VLEELFLVRHAAPDRSLPMPYNVLPGPPLTAAGVQEAALTAIWLEGRGIEYLFVSPFERTKATADIIINRLGVPFTYTEAIREGGPGEKFEQIRARVAELLVQLDDSPFRRVALVSHGAPVLAALRHTTEDRIDLKGHMYDHGNNTPTGGVWRGVRGERCWRWELAFRPVLQSVAV
jgi:2,3-bisphosphoglycerate-dependent phosphoglycerate mutase